MTGFEKCWGIYTAKGIDTPTFLKPSNISHLPAYEDGTDRVFRNVSI